MTRGYRRPKWKALQEWRDAKRRKEMNLRLEVAKGDAKAIAEWQNKMAALIAKLK